jgi:hypothetical protein
MERGRLGRRNTVLGNKLEQHKEKPIRVTKGVHPKGRKRLA